MGFAMIAAPIYRLFRKNVSFIWGVKQDKAIDTLKVALTIALALCTLVYSEHMREIILAVDASGDG